MEYQIQLYDAIESTGLQMVNEMFINNLSSKQQAELLIAKFATNSNENETIITASFFDYITGRPIISCRGAFLNIGFTQSANVKMALNNLNKQIIETFQVK